MNISVFSRSFILVRAGSLLTDSAIIKLHVHIEMTLQKKIYIYYKNFLIFFDHIESLAKKAIYIDASIIYLEFSIKW